MSIRYRVRVGSAPFGEGVGVLQSVSADATGAPVLKLVNRRGDTVVVPLADLVAAKAL